VHQWPPWQSLALLFWTYQAVLSTQQPMSWMRVALSELLLVMLMPPSWSARHASVSGGARRRHQKGTLPFDGSVMEVLMAHIHNTPDAMSSRRREELDQALEALILRAMAKDPAQRHGSASAFRYELNTVMDMLDMGRRRPRGSGLLPTENPRENVIVQAFERSRMPMALVSLDGVVSTANKAFNKLCNQDDKGCEGLSLTETTLASFVPGLMRALRSVHVDGKATERRARVFRGNDRPPLELIVWLTPTPIPGSEIQMLVRAEEIDPRAER
jgi:serine/threonine protein kinase